VIVFMRTFTTSYCLSCHGWNNVKVGSNVPMFCKTCGQQSLHMCSGMRKDGDENILRFECVDCCYKIGINLNFIRGA
jgi:hypothetical protein